MRISCLCSALFIAACSSSTSPTSDSGQEASAPDGGVTDTGPACATASASVSGTIQGATLSAKDAIYAPPANGGSAFVVIADSSNLCSLAQANANKANAKALSLTFTGGPPKVGATSVGPMMLEAQYLPFDAMCSITSASADSGSVTITKADSCGLVGTFDLTFGADKLTGSFTAPTCAIPASDGGQTTCQQ